MTSQPSFIESAAQWIEKVIGVEVPAYRHPMVKMALETLGNGDAAAGYGEIVKGNRNAEHQLMSASQSSETYFFRHPGHFEALDAFARKRLAAGKNCSVLSAGCSSGEEAWSAAAVLADIYREKRGACSVLGCDVSLERTLKAQGGFYRSWSLRQGFAGYEHFFRQENDGWRVTPELQAITRFEAKNLMTGDLQFGKFDVIFFRNVSIYWNLERTRGVLEWLCAMLAPDGLLMVGPSDPVPVSLLDWESVIVGGALLYRRRTAAATPLRVPPAPIDIGPQALAVPISTVQIAPRQPESDPVTAMGDLNRVKQLAAEGHFQKALECLLADGHRKSNRHRLWEGILQLSLGEDKEARRIFRMCVYLEPDEPLFHRWLAAALVANHRHGEADRERKLADELEELS